MPLIATRFTECFVVGITIYLSYRGRADRLTWLVLAGAMLLSLIDDHGRSSGHFPFTLATSGLAVWLAARGRLWPLLLQPFPFLGRISYALYLVHQMIGRIVGDALRLHGVSQGASLALRVATALILAAALTFLVERPAHDALIGLVGRRRIPGEVSSA